MAVRNDVVSGSSGFGREFLGGKRASLSDPLIRWAVCLGLGLVVVVGVLPIVTVSPTQLAVGPPLAGPSWDHLFGTDQVGRDVFARVVHGARISLTVAAASVVLALVAGGILGAIAVSAKSWIGELIMRVMDVALAFPGILLAIVLAAVIGPSMTTTIIVLAVIYTPSMARVVRGAVFAEYGRDYVTAARLLGTSRIRLVGYHIGANAALPIMVYSTLLMADAIVAEAGLSFLGAGIKAPAPSWGNIMRDGQTVMSTGAWWISVFPGVVVVVTVLAINRFSEALGRRR